MKRLSIITICYNEPDVEKTCESIVNQTWQDFEWIVIDGGSNKETLDIFEKYKNRIDKFISEPDNGIYNACNKGIKLAEGEFVNFMNAGDCFCNNLVLEKVFKNKNYSSDILYGNTYINKKTSVKKHYAPLYIDKYFWITDNINHQSSFIRLELFKKYGLYSENYKIISDYEKWILYSINNVNFKYLGLFIANFDALGLSSSRKDLANKEIQEVLKKYYSDEEIKSVQNDNEIKYSFI